VTTVKTICPRESTDLQHFYKTHLHNSTLYYMYGVETNPTALIAFITTIHCTVLFSSMNIFTTVE
jgi:hypothetical protein